mmetsp:Transcript_26244/g.4520  ORF Transcript_26244/g.4520 Transcript_26244/m.4520 type:complete len:80 (+) Transcript_26244:568-807(+)
MQILYGVVSGSIKFTISGESSANYYLDRDVLKFNTIASDVQGPDFYDIRLTKVTRTTAQLEIVASEVATVHILYTPAGT